MLTPQWIRKKLKKKQSRAPYVPSQRNDGGGGGNFSDFDNIRTHILARSLTYIRVSLRKSARVSLIGQTKLFNWLIEAIVRVCLHY